MRDRIGNRPLYISVDIDVLDPAHAPGTGTPEAGGMTSRELLEILRGFRGLNLIGADVVEVVDKLRQRLGNRPVYVSIDIDVLDPAHAPGTGTPEAGGMTSRELLEILRGFRGLNLIGADVVEVAPAYDHAEITSVAAAHVAYDLVSLLAMRHEERVG